MYLAIILEFVPVLEAKNSMSGTLMNFYYFKRSRTIAALTFVFYFLSYCKFLEVENAYLPK